MSRITQELLRKRSQHNESCLTNLEEISLHQQELVKIENLDILCRHLKILYLQNNIIQKLQNLNKLKELQYLNIALNNISAIENIQGCESLKKLDFTVNFIDVFQLADSVKCLKLYLTGNPCQDWKGCKDYVIAHVPTLQVYNGESITPSQRIKASQNIESLKSQLLVQIGVKKVEKLREKQEEEERKKLQAHLSPQEKAKLKSAYTKQSRRQMYYEMAQQKEKKEREKNPQKYKVQKEPQMFRKSDGEIRQCNEGKFTYKLKQYEDPDYSFFQLQVPKHLDTSELVVNINPKWVSVKVKNKLVQLKLSQEIIIHQSKTERSQITGFLLIKLKKLVPQQFLRNALEKEKKRKREEEAAKKKEEEQEKQKRLRLCEEYERKMEMQENEIPDLQ